MSYSSDHGAHKQGTTVPPGIPVPDQPSATKSLISDGKFRSLYASMLKCRMLTRAINRTLDNAIPRHREASKVGCAIDLRNSDVLSCAKNDYIAQFLGGIPPRDLILEVGRKARGVSHPALRPLPPKLLPPVRIADLQIALATGVALDLKRANSDNLVMVFCPPASESLDSAEDALEFAGEQKLPMIFVVQRQARGKTSTPKRSKKPVDAYGFPSIPVDGTDCIAVYRVAFEAMYKARIGAGPTLIECVYESKSPDPVLHLERQLTRRDFSLHHFAIAVIKAFSPELRISRPRRRSSPSGTS